MPDLRQLRVFVAVAEERNFTRAAERLHLAQQAVSKSVAQLERELGVEPVERTSREVRPTAAGEALRADAEPLLAAADAAFARARDHGRGLAGALAVGITTAVGAGVVDAAVAALRRRRAGALRRHPRGPPGGDRAGAARAPARRRARAQHAGGAGLDPVTLPPTPAVLVVPPDHRLAGRSA